MSGFITLDTYEPYTLTLETSDGKSLAVQEIDMAARARLQKWIADNAVHPLEAIKPLLEKMPPESRAALAAEAAKKCASWPPRLDSAEGWAAIMGNDEGNIAVILEGLRAADPKAKPDDARRLFTTLDRATRRGNSALAAKVVGCIFGRIDPNEEEPAAEPEGRDESEPTAENTVE